MKVGILGCGVISSTYIKSIKLLYPELEVVACADVDEEKARECATTYGIAVSCCVEELFQDEEIEIIINLTPPKYHYELNLRILGSGKHLFCEKPFALTLSQAEEIKQLAEKRGLMIGAAPDTFLEAGMQRSKKLLACGAIGRPLYVTANMMSFGMEAWHPSPEQFYQYGAGPLYDMGPYYLSAIVTLLGPVKRIMAFAGTGFETRNIYTGPLKGNSFQVETPTYYSSLLELASGVLVTFNISFDIIKSSLPILEIYGTEGTIQLPDPNIASGMPKVLRREEIMGEFSEKRVKMTENYPNEEELKAMFPEKGEYIRGAGVWELAQAIAGKGVNKANVELACHIIEIINGIMESSISKNSYDMKTSLHIF